ncbi:MAG: alpha/beta hydrolase [Candidatus Eremiobacteraeota bacterium]|nr:alpha/beta hydrolase [Candidatus Eremiobacteraeota bacterium]
MKAFTCLLRAALIGAIAFSQIAAASPQKRVPYDVNLYLHPQRLVDIGGRRLNLVCTGHGSPTVILEAGMLADSSAWRRVQPAISQTTKVCAYDRAGMGFSDPSGAPRDASAIVRDLHALLRTGGVAGPYVLVGWSSGGLFTRLYQYRYPSDVVGLVEVDPDTEFNTTADYVKLVETTMKKSAQWGDQQMRDWYAQYDNCAANVSRGTCAFFPGAAKYLRANGCVKISGAECELKEIRARHVSQASFWKVASLEVRATVSDPAEVRAAERPFGKLPLIVLTDSEDGDIDASDPTISVAAQRAGWVAKNNAEERLAKLSSVGAHVVVAGTTHAILLDQPAAVTSAIEEVIDQARYNRR